jgi:hypothetical protein
MSNADWYDDLPYEEDLLSPDLRNIRNQIILELEENEIDWDKIISLATKAKSLSDYKQKWTEEQLRDIRNRL